MTGQWLCSSNCCPSWIQVQLLAGHIHRDSDAVAIGNREIQDRLLPGAVQTRAFDGSIPGTVREIEVTGRRVERQPIASVGANDLGQAAAIVVHPPDKAAQAIAVVGRAEINLPAGRVENKLPALTDHRREGSSRHQLLPPLIALFVLCVNSLVVQPVKEVGTGRIIGQPLATVAGAIVPHHSRSSLDRIERQNRRPRIPSGHQQPIMRDIEDQVLGFRQA
jgi:hypothetical protein